MIPEVGGIYGLRLLRKPGVLLVTLGLLAALVLIFRAFQIWRLTSEIQWGYDFSAYWEASRLLLQGISPYRPEQLLGPYAPQQQYLYLYPPPLAAAVAPLGALFADGYRGAAWIWAGLGAFVLFVSVLEVARAERLGDRYPLLAGRGRWLLVAAAFAFPPVVGELVLGNVHLLLVGLLALAWVARVRSGDGRDPRWEWIAGAAVGVAAVIKVFPAVLLLWFLLTRRWRGSAGVVVGAVVAALLALPLTGIQPWLDYPTVLANLSAPSDTRDTLAPTVWLAGAAGFTIARIAVTAAGLALLAWSARTSDARRSFAVAVTVSILIAPALYHHYLAMLVLPFLLALACGVPIKWLALAYFLMWGGQQDALADASWIVNRAMPTLGALVLLASLAFVRRPEAAIRAPAAAPA